MLKWFLQLFSLYWVAVLITALIWGELFWGFVFNSMIYAPFYIGALLPAYTYYINQDLKLYADLLTYIFCFIGFAIAFYLGFMTFNLELAQTFFAALPLAVIVIKTMHRRAMGY